MNLRRLNTSRHYRFLRFTSRHWRMRVVFWGGALTVGLVSILFAIAATFAENAFAHVLAHPWLALIITPTGFFLSVLLARTIFPGSEGSGIPQAIAARRFRDQPTRERLLSLRLTFGKILLTLFGLACGASIGREGPTVQVGAAIMLYTRAQAAWVSSAASSWRARRRASRPPSIRRSPVSCSQLKK